MDDLFSNGPKKDEFEDISSFSKSGDEFEDIFSNSDREIHPMFSDLKKDGPVKGETEVTLSSGRKIDTSYFTDDNSDGFFSDGGGNMAKKNDKYEDISSFSDGYEDISSAGNKNRKKKIIIISVLASLALIIGGVLIYFLLVYNSIIDNINFVKPEKNKYIDESELVMDKEITNILLIGSDTRVDDTSGSRSDTTILLSIDSKNKQFKLTSFLRDTYIEIPEHGSSKLNAAFSWGGPQLLKDTLEYNFKIKIDYFVTIDFESFKEIIDALGGVDVEITDNEARYINSQDHMTQSERDAFPNQISGGMNHFNGAQALWYCRIRYLDNDFNRTERQRKTLNAALDVAKKKNFNELVEIAKLGASKVTTDASKSIINKYVNQGIGFLKYEIVGMQVPADGTWSNEMTNAGDSLVLDLEANKEKLNSFIYGGKYVEPAQDE